MQSHQNRAKSQCHNDVVSLCSQTTVSPYKGKQETFARIATN